MRSGQLVLSAIVALAPGIGVADTFQFFDRTETAYVANARVQIAGKTVGFTDAYGRLTLDEPVGPQELQIQRRGGTRKVSVTIDGQRPVKKVIVP